jgi:hypothetical protein
MAYFTITTRTRNFAIEASDRFAAIRRLPSLLTAEEADRYRIAAIEEHATVEDARLAFVVATDDLDYRDNYRTGFEDDAASMAAYNEIADSGCCGSIDKRYVIGGRLAFIGCNYGH